MPITTVFLDDGDVMNDNEPRGEQWRTLIGEYFVPRLGGDAESWAEANRAVFEAQWDMVVRGPGDERFLDWWDRYQYEWMSGMAERVGVAMPDSSDAVIDLAKDVSLYVTRRVRSAFPGAVETIRALSERGYELHTASNEVSWELDGYLTGMGVREHFNGLYGPDLVDATKHTADYYTRMFDDAGVTPGEAVVVDDSADHLDHAASLGATTFQVSAAPAGSPSHRVIRRLAELPAALENPTT